MHIHQSASERLAVRWTDATVDSGTMSISDSAVCNELDAALEWCIHHF